jgi:hypothetical protein
MLPQRRFSGDKTPIRAAEWNQLVEPTSKLGTQTPSPNVERTYVTAVGRNDCGYDLVPGSPVVLSTFTADRSPAQLGNAKAGWLSLRPCYLPRTLAESNAVQGDLFSIGITLDAIAQNASGPVAVSGVVECNCHLQGRGWISPMTQVNNDFRSKVTVNGMWGVARKICDTGTGLALIDLNSSNNRIFYQLKEQMKIPALSTLATLQAFSEDYYVLDSFAIAQWQANEDRGEAMLLANRWVVVNPWCVDDTLEALDPLQEDYPPTEDPPPPTP